MSDQITIRTSIKSGLKRSLLIRGTVLAAIGMALLLYAGITISLPVLSQWGAAIWLISIFLIALGMIPYRRVVKIENNPNQIMITDDGLVHYHRHGRDVFTLPLDAIEEVRFLEDMGLYGIAVTLKESEREKIPYPAISVVMQMFQWSLKRNHSFDRFFPFFSERGARKLQELIESRH